MRQEEGREEGRAAQPLVFNLPKCVFLNISNNGYDDGTIASLVLSPEVSLVDISQNRWVCPLPSKENNMSREGKCEIEGWLFIVPTATLVPVAAVIVLLLLCSGVSGEGRTLRTSRRRVPLAWAARSSSSSWQWLSWPRTPC